MATRADNLQNFFNNIISKPTVKNFKIEEYKGATFFTYETHGAKSMYFGGYFAAKKSKPYANNYAFDKKSIDEMIESAKERIDRDLLEDAKRAERLSAEWDQIQVGTIMYSIWGCEQTNVNFYQVTAKTDKTVKVREIEADTRYTSDMAGYKAPIADKFREHEKEITLRGGHGKSLKISNFEWLSPIGDHKEFGFSSWA